MVAIWNAMAVAYGIKDEEELIVNIYTELHLYTLKEKRSHLSMQLR